MFRGSMLLEFGQVESIKKEV